LYQPQTSKKYISSVNGAFLSPRGKCAIKLDLLEVTVATIIKIVNDLNYNGKCPKQWARFAFNP
jgi:hypothetical protein